VPGRAKGRATSRVLLRRVHAVAAAVAVLLPSTFLMASVAAELSGMVGLVAGVKRGVLLAIPLLVIAMAVTVLSGRRLAGRSRHPTVRRKMARIKVIAPTAVLVLVPAAVVLDRLASVGAFGPTFLAVQGLELVAGAVNVTLLLLNVRDGLALRPRATTRHNHAREA
jgi:hypothetical protein